ncbi:MAG: hypothetical protein KDK36_08625 [Leptospiraceae bacterium]|nr:hypothetical protein [Leptospiraceae bacterium]
MKTINKSYYLFEILDNVLVIIDLDKGMSVTNNINEILEEIESEIVKLPELAIYRDSMKVFDGIEHSKGKFKRFYPIQETDLEIALKKVKEINL